VTRGLLFDLYGTLVPGNTDKDRDETSHRIAAVLDVDPSQFATAVRNSRAERFGGALGDAASTIRTLVRRLGAPTPSPAAIDYAVRERLNLTDRQLTPGSGILALLDLLRADGWRLGLLTNCSIETVTLWPTTVLASRFDAAVFSCALGVAKPDPRSYQAVLDRLDLPPSSCVFVGDGASNELAGAQSLGIPAVLFATDLADPHTDTTDWSGPQANSPADLPVLLAQLTSGRLEPRDRGNRPDPS